MAAEPLSNDRFAQAARSVAGTRHTGARRADRRVVESMARKVARPCRRSDCPAPARASVMMDYQRQVVTLVPLPPERDPRFLEVCPTHASSMRVPRGWDLLDERDEPPPPQEGPPSAREMADSSTVAVLAAALREPGPAADLATPGPTGSRASDEGSARPAGSASPTDPGDGDEPADAVDPDEPVVVASAAARAAAGLRAVAGRADEPAAPVHDERQLVLEQLDEADSLARRARPVRAARDE